MASEKRIRLGIVLLAAIQAVRHSGCALVKVRFWHVPEEWAGTERGRSLESS
jgi:hypothetical protein